MIKRNEYVFIIKSKLSFDMIKLNNILKSFDKDFELIYFERKKPLNLKKLFNK